MAFQINTPLTIYFYLFIILSIQLYSANWWKLYGDILKWKSNDTSKVDRIAKDLTLNSDEIDTANSKFNYCIQRCLVPLFDHHFVKLEGE